jgi:hypothetical protein
MVLWTAAILMAGILIRFLRICQFTNNCCFLNAGLSTAVFGAQGRQWLIFKKQLS